jgi:hypothetical protein
MELNNFGKVNLRLLKEKALILSRIQIISLSSNNGPIWSEMPLEGHTLLSGRAMSNPLE